MLRLLPRFGPLIVTESFSIIRLTSHGAESGTGMCECELPVPSSSAEQAAVFAHLPTAETVGNELSFPEATRNEEHDRNSEHGLHP